MTVRQPTRLSVEQCAEIADACIAARKPELISTSIRDGSRPEDVRQLLGKLNTCAARSDANQLNMQVLEEAAVERFCFAALNGEGEITR